MFATRNKGHRYKEAIASRFLLLVGWRPSLVGWGQNLEPCLSPNISIAVRALLVMGFLSSLQQFDELIQMIQGSTPLSKSTPLLGPVLLYFAVRKQTWDL